MNLQKHAKFLKNLTKTHPRDLETSCCIAYTCRYMSMEKIIHNKVYVNNRRVKIRCDLEKTGTTAFFTNFAYFRCTELYTDSRGKSNYGIFFSAWHPRSLL